MSQQQLMPWLVTAIAASVAAMVSGAHSGLPHLTSAAALLFALVIVAAAVEINRPLWRLEAGRLTPDAAPVAIRRNARLMALAYAWGAAGMFAVYRLSGLRWQHGWQYGLAMLLLAALLLLYVHLLGGRESQLRQSRALLTAQKLVVLQGAGAIAGLGFLLASGKIWSTRSDWAANQIFLAGGLAIAALSLIAAITQSRLARRA